MDHTKNSLHITENTQNLEDRILISLDAEKAFSGMNWQCRCQTMETFGFGPKFQRCMLAGYGDARGGGSKWAFYSISGYKQENKAGLPLMHN